MQVRQQREDTAALVGGGVQDDRAGLGDRDGGAGENAVRRRDVGRGEVVVLAASQKRASAPDKAFAVDALRRLVQSGARPRAAAGVVAALTGTRPNELYRELT